MKVFDKVLEMTNQNEEVTSETMLYIEDLIFNEIVDVDAITKWTEIEDALNNNRPIQKIEYEKTDVPQMVIDNLDFQKAVKKKSEQITDVIFFKMESETFEEWIMDIDYLVDLFKVK